jgi:hypothetical protein
MEFDIHEAAAVYIRRIGGQRYVVVNVKPTIIVKAADGDELPEGRQAGETDRSRVISITSPHHDSHRLAVLMFR